MSQAYVVVSNKNTLLMRMISITLALHESPKVSTAETIQPVHISDLIDDDEVVNQVIFAKPTEYEIKGIDDSFQATPFNNEGESKHSVANEFELASKAVKHQIEEGKIVLIERELPLLDPLEQVGPDEDTIVLNEDE